ncbi:RNase H domain-containing protein [Trichoderma breve]|uniref:RNase H domain-containing protein n=1 Tax=Trichoderma breve TaxID=2034170 RepID=A0A9W9BG56_9HYPO|nr:RNase H domain-containing protein [Trichoderma breve]KAJ4862748.1 RNase H domain-containing protein [Trichoderma breve]
MGKKERMIAQENARYISSVNKVIEFSKELTKINAAHEFSFCANIVIPQRENALRTALHIFSCNFGRRHRVFYSDGSSIVNSRLNSAPPTVEHTSIIPSGAAVVYKTRRDENWNMKYFTPTSRGRDTIFTEVAAIAHALTIAMAERALYLDDNKKHSNGKARWSKVTIFSDCIEALKRISRLREIAIADAQSLCDPILRQIMSISHYFYGNEVQIELRWVPGHSRVQGNCLADTAARYAANHQNVGMLLPEGLNWDTEPLSNDVKTHG